MKNLLAFAIALFVAAFSLSSCASNQEAVRSIDRVQLVEEGQVDTTMEEESTETAEEEVETAAEEPETTISTPAVTPKSQPAATTTSPDTTVSNDNYYGDSSAANVDAVNFGDSDYGDYTYDSPAADTSGINWGDPDYYADYEYESEYTDYGFGEYYDTGFDDYDQWE